MILRIPVSLAPRRGGVLQLRGNLVHGANHRRIFYSYFANETEFVVYLC